MGTKATLLICSEDLAQALNRSMTKAVITVFTITITSKSSTATINSCLLEVEIGYLYIHYPQITLLRKLR